MPGDFTICSSCSSVSSEAFGVDAAADVVAGALAAGLPATAARPPPAATTGILSLSGSK